MQGPRGSLSVLPSLLDILIPRRPCGRTCSRRSTPGPSPSLDLLRRRCRTSSGSKRSVSTSTGAPSGPGGGFCLDPILENVHMFVHPSPMSVLRRLARSSHRPSADRLFSRASTSGCLDIGLSAASALLVPTHSLERHNCPRRRRNSAPCTTHRGLPAVVWYLSRPDVEVYTIIRFSLARRSPPARAHTWARTMPYDSQPLHCHHRAAAGR